jgi:hypothetical protein
MLFPSLLIAIASVSAQQSDAQELKNRLHAIVQAYHEADEFHGLALIAREGELARGADRK